MSYTEKRLGRNSGKLTGNYHHSQDTQPCKGQKRNDKFITGFHGHWIEWFELKYEDQMS